mmetsp:Transcript_26380/g.52981  ORF Transcript_26380/g.52981 Transcript_26380/m.52981 type:complete len:336 (+) Transcript_26380:1721-2728(+)
MELEALYSETTSRYMYDPITFTPVCWSGDGHNRWLQAKIQRIKTIEQGVLHDKSGRSRVTDGQCLRPGLVGPFPFPRGPFQAYSQVTARLLVELLSPNESYVLDRRRKLTLTHPITGRTVSRGAKGHPALELLVEDVHFGYLQLIGFGKFPLTIIDMSLCNLANVAQRRRKVDFAGPQMCGSQQWQMDVKLQPYIGRPRGLYQADVYHGVKQPSRIGYMLERPRLLHIPKKRELVCRRPHEGPTLGEVMHRLHGCCGSWRMCRFMQEAAYLPPENLYPAVALPHSFKELPTTLRNATWIPWSFDLRRNGTLARIQQRERELGSTVLLNTTLPVLM